MATYDRPQIGYNPDLGKVAHILSNYTPGKDRNLISIDRDKLNELLGISKEEAKSNSFVKIGLAGLLLFVMFKPKRKKRDS